MKQLSILAVVVVLALAGFYFTRDRAPETPAHTTTQRPVAGGQPAPRTQRPNVVSQRGDRRRTITSPGGHEVLLSEEALERMRMIEETPWRDTVDPSVLVRVEDAWGFDYSTVDFERDVLATVAGVPITKTDFQRHVVLELGQVLLRSEFFAAAGRRVAARSGLTYGLTDEQFDLYLAKWAERNHKTPEQGVDSLALMSRQTVEGARYWRRNILEAVLAFYPVSEGLEAIPLELQAVLNSQAAQADVATIVGLLKDKREELNDPDNMASLVAMVEPMALMWQKVGMNEIFERSWTYLDDDAMPADTIAGYFDGELPLEVVVPPWKLQGEVTYVATEPLWNLVEPLLNRQGREELLRSLVWGKVLKAVLEREGALPSADAAWTEYAAGYLQSRVAALPMDFIVLSLYEYPGIDQYRFAERIQAGFRNLQADDWDDEEHLREFFRSQRFFIENWQPDFDIALFPPRDAASAYSGKPDWEGARASAQAFIDAVEAGGDFDQLLAEHMNALSDSFREHLGDNVARDFAEAFRSGHLKAPVAQIQSVVKERRYNHFLGCASVIENAIVRLDRGEISPPWRTPVGYVVVRMNHARLTALESEFEDLIDATRTRYYDVHFLLWANSVLAQAEFEAL